ncbi:MAG: hypothetical protein WB973_22050 [Thermoanaerobaculia bacterium]
MVCAALLLTAQRGYSDDAAAPKVHPLCPEAVSTYLATVPHRLAIVFWPQLAGCPACDLTIAETLDEMQSERADIAIVSIAPESAIKFSSVKKLPGKTIFLSSADYARYVAVAPKPRVEMWDAAGQLLLLRTIPNYSGESELLDQELLSARSFTAPVSRSCDTTQKP